MNPNERDKEIRNQTHEEVFSQRKERRFQHNLGMRMLKVLNILLVVLPFAACWYGFYRYDILISPSAIRSGGIVLMFAVLFCFFGRVYDAFMLSLKRIREMVYSQFLSILMADAFMFLILWLMSGHFPVLFPALLALAGQTILSVLWCYWAHRWYFAHYGGQKTAVVYDVRHGMEGLFGQYGLEKKFKVCFSCTVEECLNAQMRCLDGMETVFLCGVHSMDRNRILKYCVAHGIDVYMIPRLGDVIMSGAERMHMFHLPILRVQRYSPKPEYLFFKRAFDVVTSLLAILVFSPVMLVTAAAVKMHDGGPVLYKQTRLTKDGRTFKLLKFRSMRVDAEKDGVARLSSGENDDRITPVGRFIRGCRIDELPQLFNILEGSMSVVGPRPERPEIAAQYEKDMPEFALRLQAKAGLTGYAQVYGKYNTIPYDKLQMDLMYIARPSFVEDMKIVFATIMILFMKESTEGIAEGQTTAASKHRDLNADKKEDIAV